ncbi:MAG: hypothetical protein AB2L20_27625 [Mangrovibacterium sp.]
MEPGRQVVYKYDEGDCVSYENGKYQDKKETQTGMLYKDFE